MSKKIGKAAMIQSGEAEKSVKMRKGKRKVRVLEARDEEWRSSSREGTLPGQVPAASPFPASCPGGGMMSSRDGQERLGRGWTHGPSHHWPTAEPGLTPAYSQHSGAPSVSTKAMEMPIYICFFFKI